MVKNITSKFHILPVLNKFRMANKIELLLDGIPLRGINRLTKKDQTERSMPGIIDQIDRLTKETYLKIGENQALLPLNEQGKELTAKKFKKRYNSLSIQAPRTQIKAIETQADPQRLTREAIERRNKKVLDCEEDNISCRGYGWAGISTDRRHRLIPLVECIRGLVYLANFEIELSDYGRACTGEMSSKTDPKTTTKASIDSLPIDPEQHYAQWINLNTNSTTKRQLYDCLHHGYAATEVYWDFHSIATLLKRATSNHAKNKRGLEQLLSNPMLLPNKSLLEFFHKLNNQIVKLYWAEDGSQEKIKPRKLNLAEKENLLWWKVYKEQRFSRSFVEDPTFSYIPGAIKLARF